MSNEHAYAYEAGYRDGSIHYELEHCPACKNVADLQEALAENANLRERITTQKQTIQAYRDESREWREVAERAQAENAKLRDENSRLQKYASKALSAISYCDCCPYVDCGCDTETVPMHEGCKAFEELSELGVEVE